MAKALGRTTPASIYSPDLLEHSPLSSDKFVKAAEKNSWQSEPRPVTVG